MLNKFLAIIFLLLITACGVSIYLSVTPSSIVIPAKAGIQTLSVTPPSPVIPAKAGIQTPVSPLDPRFHGDDNVREDNNTLPATLQTPDKKYETTIAENSTIYDLMKKLSQTDGLQFSSRGYSGLGQFVKEINGVEENKQQGIYWLLYINGQSASTGISNYIIKPNDLISWKYDKAQF